MCHAGIIAIQCELNVAGRGVLTIDFKRLTSSSWATTLLRRPFLRLSELSSPRMTRSMTSLSSATLLLYAATAPYGSSFVESSLTASRASSRAFVKAFRDDGRGSDERGSGGERSRRSECLTDDLSPHLSEYHSVVRRDLEGANISAADLGSRGE